MSDWVKTKAFRDAMLVCDYLSANHLTVVAERIASSIGTENTAAHGTRGERTSTSASSVPFSKDEFDALCRKVYKTVKKYAAVIDTTSKEVKEERENETLDADLAAHLAGMLQKSKSLGEEEGKNSGECLEKFVRESVEAMIAAITLSFQSAAFHGLKAEKLKNFLLGQTTKDDMKSNVEPSCNIRTATLISEVWAKDGRQVISRLSDSGRVTDKLAHTEWRVVLEIAKSGTRKESDMVPQTLLEMQIQPPIGSSRQEKNVALELNECEAERLFYQLEAIQMEIDSLND